MTSYEIHTLVRSSKNKHSCQSMRACRLVKIRVSFFVATTDVNQLPLHTMPKANDILECGFLDRRLNRIIILMAATLVLFAIIAIGIVSNMGLENATGSTKICKRFIFIFVYSWLPYTSVTLLLVFRKHFTPTLDFHLTNFKKCPPKRKLTE